MELDANCNCYSTWEHWFNQIKPRHPPPPISVLHVDIKLLSLVVDNINGALSKLLVHFYQQTNLNLTFSTTNTVNTCVCSAPFHTRCNASQFIKDKGAKLTGTHSPWRRVDRKGNWKGKNTNESPLQTPTGPPDRVGTVLDLKALPVRRQHTVTHPCVNVLVGSEFARDFFNLQSFFLVGGLRENRVDLKNKIIFFIQKLWSLYLL